MRVALRTIAVLIAIAGVVDPAATRVISRPPPVEVVLPPTSHPDYPRALAVRTGAAEQLEGAAHFADVNVPRARLAIGRPPRHADPSVPLFAWFLPPPAVSIEALHAPHRAAATQQIVVQARLRGRGVEGQTSSIRLRADGVTLAASEYEWRRPDEAHTAELLIPGLPEGTHRLQVLVVTSGETVRADDSVMVSAAPRRVLVYEPRPSWPAAFARRSLEADRSFDLSALARSAAQVTTTSGDRPAPLSASRLDEFDALVLGGLDAVSDHDARLIAEFVNRRGGTLVLWPDGRIPEGLRQRFGLPALEELLLQDPVLLDGGPVAVRASELLVPAHDSPVTTILEVERDKARRPVVFATPLGNGTVVLVGALDAWRYRGTEQQDLDRFTRALLAEAAAGAPPLLAVTLEEAVERPGEPVEILATLRETEFVAKDGRTILPPIAAAIVDENGRREMVRLWPTTRVGEFAGAARLARAGRYLVEVTAGPRRAQAVLTIADDATHARNGEYPLAAAATLTGGAAHESLDELRENLAALGSTVEAVRFHPMRSAWWMVPFVALLSTEWILRRRAGLR